MLSFTRRPAAAGLKLDPPSSNIHTGSAHSRSSSVSMAPCAPLSPGYLPPWVGDPAALGHEAVAQRRPALRVRVATSFGTAVIPCPEGATIAWALAEVYSRIMKIDESMGRGDATDRLDNERTMPPLTFARTLHGDILDIDDLVSDVCDPGETIIALSLAEAARLPLALHPIFHSSPLQPETDSSRVAARSEMPSPTSHAASRAPDRGSAPSARDASGRARSEPAQTGGSKHQGPVDGRWLSSIPEGSSPTRGC
ncbi:uncharacterized protein BJ171DRAFT_568510 [Polychytrium aggregatum]|uniref:uncharacterized protein n=1 Tax=Polychytrium aggregatum TaxID=110093 RepID=UPI0022FE47F4|nr:uncharacterized protein BJ171DRAFT_568510 [Polychytrium aggregatum]KAI9204051.1 hypothetical protein BJ171DRAFT_568510 [Polychytrium aggregatum]